MAKSKTAASVVVFGVIAFGAIGIVGAFAGFARKSVEETKTPASAVSPSGDSVWVTRSDGAKSCSPDSGQSLEEGAATLKKAKVRVFESRKGNDGMMHAQMCGAPSGSTNSFLISKEDLPLAASQGYTQVK